jgi:hypothetical protein
MRVGGSIAPRFVYLCKQTATSPHSKLRQAADDSQTPQLPSASVSTTKNIAPVRELSWVADRYICVSHQKLVLSHQSTSVRLCIFNVVVSTRWCYHFFCSSSIRNPTPVDVTPNFLIKVIASPSKLSHHHVKGGRNKVVTHFLCLFSLF